MAVILTSDIMQGARLEVAPGQVKVTRVFLAENIPTTIPRALLPLALATSGLPQWGNGHEEVPTATVQRFIVYPTGEPNSAYIDVIYEQATVGNFSTWYIVDDTILVQEMTEINDGGGGIRAKFTPPKSTGPATPGTSPMVQQPFYFYGAVPRWRPHRTLTVTGLLRTPPSGEILNAVGCVNSKLWTGARIGFWLCTRARADAHLFTKQLVKESGIQPRGVGITAVFMNRVRRNWMEEFGYRDHFGKLVNIDPKIVREARAKDYVYDQLEYEKYTLVGNYPILDFRDTFGFGESGSVTPTIGNSFGHQTHQG